MSDADHARKPIDLAARAPNLRARVSDNKSLWTVLEELDPELAKQAHPLALRRFYAAMSLFLPGDTVMFTYSRGTEHLSPDSFTTIYCKICDWYFARYGPRSLRLPLGYWVADRRGTPDPVIIRTTGVLCRDELKDFVERNPDLSNGLGVLRTLPYSTLLLTCMADYDISVFQLMGPRLEYGLSR